ncbi:hypothetical protein OB905_04930 [Halobacteria archaeon AArc-dxtr1]|nr:hypothetical protein [Halobacteria archaeon AArc-dxtr1]
MSGPTSAVDGSDNAADSTIEIADHGSDTTPVFAVVSAVAEASGTDLLELPPLHDFIDPDALNNLFTGHATVEHVTFQYAGYDVVVRGSDDVQVGVASDA